MICPNCGAEYEVPVRWFRATELQPVLLTVTCSTVKIKPNPEYRLPDEPAHDC